MEAAAAKLAGELAEYKAESRQLRNQEHTIRRLEERARTLEAQLEEKVVLTSLGPPKTTRLPFSLLACNSMVCWNKKLKGKVVLKRLAPTKTTLSCCLPESLNVCVFRFELLFARGLYIAHKVTSMLKFVLDLGVHAAMLTSHGQHVRSGGKSVPF